MTKRKNVFLMTDLGLSKRWWSCRDKVQGGIPAGEQEMSDNRQENI